MTNPEFRFDETPITPLMFIEASAGTGKTYTLQRLVLRFIVEKSIPIESFLIVTYTEAATAELSGRVREILSRAELGLSPGSEPKLTESEQKEFGKLRERWRHDGITLEEALLRVRRSLEEFDRCAIYTIHSFCRKMLESWAFSGGNPFEGEIGDDASVQAAAIDEFKRRYLNDPAYADPELAAQILGFDVAGFLRWKRSHPGAAVSFPDADPALGPMFSDMSEHLESEIIERKNRLSLMSFDDILIRMEKTAYESADFRNRVRSLYQAVLVDEFQDTDTIQYRIFRRLFIESQKEGGPACYAVFVGDPKQSIYGFRGADIGTYLRARDEASAVLPPYTLSTNYRTTPAEVSAVNTLFTDAAGNSRFPGGIGYSPVKSTANHFPLFVREGSQVKPLSAFELWSGRWVEGTEAEETWPRCIGAEAMRETEAELIARRVAWLLDPAREVYVGNRLADPKKTLAESRIRAGDIALLVKNHSDSEVTESKLASLGIRTLHKQSADVFATDEAYEILSVLRAAANPESRTAVNSARATRICGRTLPDLMGDGADDLYLADLEKFRAMADDYQKRGLYAAFTKLFAGFETVRQNLGRTGGERSITNWFHIAELLHAADERIRNLEGILRWYGLEVQKANNEDRDSDTPDGREIRVESDESLVRVVTIHSSKGLEYPVVFLPEAGKLKYSPPRKKKGQIRAEFFRNGESDWEALFKPTKERQSEGAAEEKNECCRLAYVAATRASALLVIPMLPNCSWSSSKKADPVLKVYGSRNQSVWTNLIGAEESKTFSVKRMNEALDVFSERLKAESPFASGTLKEEMAAELRKVTSEIEDPEKKTLLLAAADSLEAMEPEDTAKVVNVEFTAANPELPDPIDLRASPESVTSVLTPRPLFPSWHLTSYTGLTRGLELETDELADEGYDIVGDTRSKKDPGKNSPAFLRGGKDTGDAVHGLLEAAVNTGLHLDPAFLAGKKAGTDRFHDLVSRSRFLALLSDKVPDSVGADDPETREAVRTDAAEDWLCDRIRGIFLSGFSPDGSVSLRNAPPGCALPEVPFSIHVRNRHLTADQFFRTLVAANAKLPSDRQLPLVPVAAADAKRSLTGFLEGRIDLMFEERESGLFWLADWKTDQPGDERRGAAEDYNPAALMTLMREEKYGWQALIYLVALRRYLGQAFDETPDEALRRIGGMAYVFIRGYSGKTPPDTPPSILLKPDASLVRLADSLLFGEN